MKQNFAYITKLLAIKTIIKKILNIDCDERASLVGTPFCFSIFCHVPPPTVGPDL